MDQRHATIVQRVYVSRLEREGVVDILQGLFMLSLRQAQYGTL
jgi:hypothetical protein